MAPEDLGEGEIDMKKGIFLRTYLDEVVALAVTVTVGADVTM